MSAITITDVFNNTRLAYGFYKFMSDQPMGCIDNLAHLLLNSFQCCDLVGQNLVMHYVVYLTTSLVVLAL